MTQADSKKTVFLDSILHFGELKKVGNRPITLEEASLDKRLVRHLARFEGKATAAQMRRVAGVNWSPKEVTESLNRLLEWGLVTLEVGDNSRALIVSLTSLGAEWAKKISEQTLREVMSQAATG